MQSTKTGLRKAFSLIELIVIFVFLAMLAAVVIPRYLDYYEDEMHKVGIIVPGDTGIKVNYARVGNYLIAKQKPGHHSELLNLPPGKWHFVKISKKGAGIVHLIGYKFDGGEVPVAAEYIGTVVQFEVDTALVECHLITPAMHDFAKTDNEFREWEEKAKKTSTPK